MANVLLLFPVSCVVCKKKGELINFLTHLTNEKAFLCSLKCIKAFKENTISKTKPKGWDK